MLTSEARINVIVKAFVRALDGGDQSVKTLKDVKLAPDEKYVLTALINDEGTAGVFAEMANLEFFTLPYARKVVKKFDAKKLTVNGRAVLKTLTKKLNADARRPLTPREMQSVKGAIRGIKAARSR